MIKVKQIAGLIVAVVVCGGIFWLVKSVRTTPHGENQEMVVLDAVTVDFKVDFFRQSEDGQLSPWASVQRSVGDAVVPYVKSNDVIAVTLLRKTGAEQYEMIADAEWTKRDQDYFFSEDGRSVAISLQEAPEQYCVLGAVDMPLMGLIIQQLPRVDLEARNARLECVSL